MPTRRLFSGDSLSSLRDEALESIEAAIDRLPPESLADRGVDIETLIDEAMPTPVSIDRARLLFEVAEDEFRSLDLMSRPRLRDGVAVSLVIPFTGDGRFFQLTAATGLSDGPEGEVDGGRLRINLITASMDETTLVEDVGAHLDRIERLLSHQARTVAGWRPGLRQAAMAAITARRERLAMLERTARALEAAGYRRASGQV